jgi:hypothetical protein
MDEARPVWPHAEMTETAFRALHKMGMVVSVKAEREMTSADTSREWLTATNSKGESFTVPHNWPKAWKFVGHSSVPGLFALTYEGQQMQKTLEKIDAWEAANEADRATYERLKAKFGEA